MSVAKRGRVAPRGVFPNPPEVDDVTRAAILEHAQAVNPRYVDSGKRGVGLILDELCKTTGHRRKSAIRLLRNPPRKARAMVIEGGKLGRPKEYGFEVTGALRQIWTAYRSCLHRSPVNEESSARH